MRWQNVVVLTAGLVSSACSRSESGDRVTLVGAQRTLPADARAQLDSGNLAFRARDLDAAKRHYQRASKQAADHTAPWTGLMMVARATGDSVALQQAMRRIEQLSPGTSTSHPIGGSLPPNHPTISSGAHGATSAK